MLFFFITLRRLSARPPSLNKIFYSFFPSLSSCGFVKLQLHKKKERMIGWVGLHHLFSLNLEVSTSYGTLCPKKVGLGESGVGKGRQELHVVNKNAKEFQMEIDFKNG